MKRQVGRAARIEAFFICPCFALLCSALLFLL
ncbi:putative membrane protein, partial [Chlamydia psittaci 08-2626_L3]